MLALGLLDDLLRFPLLANRPRQLARIGELARERTEGVAFAPGGPYRGEWEELARAPGLEAFCSGYRVDVCPPTDDKPFFMNFERLSELGQATPSGYLSTVKPFTVLLVALGILAVLCALAFALPLGLVARSGRESAAAVLRVGRSRHGAQPDRTASASAG